MGLFDDVSRLLEERLDEFIKNNPHLELQALLDQVEEQERDTTQLISSLQSEQTRLESEILAIAEDIQKWHIRVNKAQTANRLDLAQAAQEREAALLRQGNQLWGRMEGTKKRLTEAQNLFKQIQQQKKELKIKAEQAKTQSAASSNTNTRGWEEGQNYSSDRYQKEYDPLEKEFQQWDMDEELERLKREINS
ncbi:TIGR04376 family protein [Aphanothece hegewaldii CCALA 016]|uniref:TIGR04376 family protein n=1 Tax=Aphanothece hegewaldii CCALA 016 TaxID=2107694 RepID=A0A2T1M3Y9_9CHRO|nr:TIGR04376 family protein [Aphanothece hegewaldii]PSF39561.1 TIGR04376 family protein [Aphanothece hegewaldii CCALA 016]